ncbi:plasmid replication protein RepC [Rhizobium lusitanum]|uniref:Replication initiation protein RepC n=1 Tax=Rhizobium lusitanum TaxID=293958 RepID=A0A7X0IVW2_9HYPH|nr:plasmid replication protein RepC [Rhizobium lusitanum]MBB6486947.1 replication initiation protein RepC [Rhizobium lusitanum]
MTETAPVASFRRVTPGIVASARLAMANDVPDIAKAEIALLLKKAAPVLGIDGTTYHVLDILLGLSRADDWKGTGRPIVAISNAKLAEFTMRSERTVIRCIRRLVEAGIAAYRDSSTGRRFIYRGDNGEINAGYGIDFTPARVRASELKLVVEQYHAKLNRELAARRDVKRLARALEDIGRAFPEKQADLRLYVSSINCADVAIEERAEMFRTLHQCVLDEINSSAEELNMSGEGDTGDGPYINRTQESLSDSRPSGTRSDERDINYDGSNAAKMAFEKDIGEIDAQEQTPASSVRVDVGDSVQVEVLGSVSIGLIQAACREAQALLGIEFTSWSSLARSGEALRRVVGLSEAGWADGRARVGVYTASAILATVLEKYIRDPELISKPGGYFRAMVDRATDRRLNLERTLFGLADGVYGK